MVCEHLNHNALPKETVHLLLRVVKHGFNREVAYGSVRERYGSQRRYAVSSTVHNEVMMQQFASFEQVIKYLIRADKGAAGVAILKDGEWQRTIVEAKVIVNVYF